MAFVTVDNIRYIVSEFAIFSQTLIKLGSKYYILQGNRFLKVNCISALFLWDSQKNQLHGNIAVFSFGGVSYFAVINPTELDRAVFFRLPSHKIVVLINQSVYRNSFYSVQVEEPILEQAIPWEKRSKLKRVG
ncbi:hypothetical protein A2533_03535 [Candidatus Falkowbacteria bacterium RIFOXYD2_FULL_35_9]|uniref:Uncharacterized protein n=1 Tax=Candidatus Falkowbacteria bacterium RIFOXYC2_FULL_36_12 TaxID=1798002 RepID=A0A1F5T0Y9_9BACT|nr:MAG: hypothetical protein A2300_01455 [Candidatus Falkowbacteria bacterium RIFOXYB2_FULL_35_7]OGF32413.1 MAG: hypothetical protein A2478_03780 [Candidatus Falkowbacteria bacterium RIFOXYC2_FULL_36_12]OGF34013.1 MAG: hypothetical protein A2223_03795 [Candidatus Falkowbacteria bacterium RIFOXYA2_FULL_35_8]OGF47380.1 MAG: hypothetical protein A2533_03535 [Candidatus Falkowbacteria bacterium RIFOXYD2_FULL_35_9]